MSLVSVLIMSAYYCYIIANDNGNTYNGYTTNLSRRLRQHNGEIKGGARATHNRGPWKFICVITSSDWLCIATAMKHEWTIKYPTRKRPRPHVYNGVYGRLNSLKLVFDHFVKIGTCIENIHCNVIAEHFDHVKNTLHGHNGVINLHCI